MTPPPDEHNEQLRLVKADLQGLLSEEPEPGDGAQTRQWVSAYEALTELLERSLQDQYVVVRNLPGPARRYMERANVVILEEELETFRGRRDYWRQQLGDGSPQPH